MDGTSLHHWDRRYTCRYYYGRRECSPFYSWGRWVVVGVVIFIVLLFALLCCLISRRRRRKGMKPMYGTGWAAGRFGGNKHHNNHQNYNQQAYPMNNNNYNYGNQPPAYGQPQQPQNTGSYFNPNDGYYGQQQYPSAGYPQQPPATYQQQGVYSPPPGPPPGK